MTDGPGPSGTTAWKSHKIENARQRIYLTVLQPPGDGLTLRGGGRKAHRVMAILTEPGSAAQNVKAIITDGVSDSFP